MDARHSFGVLCLALGPCQTSSSKMHASRRFARSITGEAARGVVVFAMKQTSFPGIRASSISPFLPRDAVPPPLFVSHPGCMQRPLVEALLSVLDGLLERERCRVVGRGLACRFNWC